MGSNRRATKALNLAFPSLAVAGGLGLLGFLRHRLQQRSLYLPDRYPDGIWDPSGFDLPAEDRWFHASDGEELHGWWIPHSRARATVLYFHGSSGSIAHQIGVLGNMRRLRVNVFAFDYRGYGRSSGKPSEQGLFRDGRAAYDHLRGALDQSPEKVVLFGHSLGGAVAVDCALDRQAAGLVVQASFTHLRDAARAVFPRWPVHLATGRRFCSLDKVGSLELPKLFIHGEADETVPVELGEKLYAAAGEPKDLYLVPRAGHNDLHRHGGWRYLRRVSRFIKRCVRGRGPEAAAAGRLDWRAARRL